MGECVKKEGGRKREVGMDCVEWGRLGQEEAMWKEKGIVWNGGGWVRRRLCGKRRGLCGMREVGAGGGYVEREGGL